MGKRRRAVFKIVSFPALNGAEEGSHIFDSQQNHGECFCEATIPIDYFKSKE